MQAQWTNCPTCHQPTMFGYACQRCGAPMSPMMGAPAPAMMGQQPRSGGGSSVGIIIGIAVGAVVLLCLGAGVVGFLMVKNGAEERSSSYSSSYSSPSKTTGGGGSTSSANRIGDRISMTQSTWTVVDVKDLGKKVEPNSEYYGDTKRTTGRFVQVHYKVTNTGKKQEVLLDTPKLVDSKSREFSAVESEMDYIPSGGKTAILETLQPSMEKNFYTIIEVPSDASDLKVQLTDLGFDGDTEEVETNL